MAENNKGLTAEQQLLALIEGQEKNTVQRPQEQAQGPVGQAMGALRGLKGKNFFGKTPITERKPPILSPEVIKARLAYFAGTMRKAIKGGDIEFSLSLVNNLLVGLICVLFVFLGYEIFVKPKTFKMLPDIMSAKKVADVSEPGLAPPKDISYYIDKLGQRDIFKPKPKEVPKPAAVEAPKPPPVVEQAMKELKLVGLSPSTNNSSSYVMIENTKTQATFFLKEGDSIDGVTVQSIFADKVILSDGKETRELK